ncbi:MAG: NAD(P)/FAD-dependent oxidoreductase [Thermodesulfobacteriota bacterium]
MHRGKRLLLLGGGHAHMGTLANIQELRSQGHEVTVVQPDIYHYYSGMGPGMLGTIYAPEEIRFATKLAVEKQGASFVQAKATLIQARERKVRLDTGQELEYDILSCNVGSSVPGVKGQENALCFHVKPIASLVQAQQKALQLLSQGHIRLGVVGGGPAAMEVAGNLQRLVQDTGGKSSQITLFAGRGFLPKLKKRIRKLARRNLERRGIKIVEQGYVAQLGPEGVLLENGQAYASDMNLLALGVRPSSLFVDSGLRTGPDQGLLVNANLQHPEYPEIFGGGDCIFFADQPLEKVGVYAVRQNPILYHNLKASLNTTALTPFRPGGEYLLIYNLGDGTGVFSKGSLTFGGRAAFWIKDWIDRKFMKRFQALEGETR